MVNTHNATVWKERLDYLVRNIFGELDYYIEQQRKKDDPVLAFNNDPTDTELEKEVRQMHARLSSIAEKNVHYQRDYVFQCDQDLISKAVDAVKRYVPDYAVAEGQRLETDVEKQWYKWRHSFKGRVLGAIGGATILFPLFCLAVIYTSEPPKEPIDPNKSIDMTIPMLLLWTYCGSVIGKIIGVHYGHKHIDENKWQGFERKIQALNDKKGILSYNLNQELYNLVAANGMVENNPQ